MQKKTAQLADVMMDADVVTEQHNYAICVHSGIKNHPETQKADAAGICSSTDFYTTKATTSVSLCMGTAAQ